MPKRKNRGAKSKSKSKPQSKTPKKNKGGRKVGSTGSTQAFKFKSKSGKEYSLTLTQKKFCELFVSDPLMSGADAVIEAGYNFYYPNSKIPNMRVASAMAYENLKKPHIIAYTDLLLTNNGFNSANIDKHWLYTIEQFSDLGAKNKAIDMYNRKKGRYPAEKREISGQIEVIELTNYGSKPSGKTQTSQD